MRSRVERLRGFTLVELLITVTIVALLAGGAVTMAELAGRRARESDLRSALREIRGAIDSYKRAVDLGRVRVAQGDSGYPPSLSALAEGAADASRPAGAARLYFLRRIPRDPFADASLRAEATWGLRSYASSPDNPQPGADVFDVYSLSGRSGLNGVPYRDW